MSRRLFAAFALVLAVTSVHHDSIEAQGRRIPVRKRSPNSDPPPTPAQGITVTDPASSIFSTTDATLPIGGTFTPQIATVSWAITPGGQSGSGVLDVNSGTYAITTPVSAIKAQDEFIRTTSAAATAHTPTTTGDGWLDLRTDAGNFCRVMAADYLQPNVSDTGGTAVVACEADPTGSISGTNYNVRLRLSPTAWSIGSSSNTALLFSIIDMVAGHEDTCALEILSASQNPDVRLIKVVDGVPTVLASADAVPAAGQRWEVRARGNTATAYRDGAAVSGLTFTDAACNRSTRTGVAWGAVYPGSGKLVSTGGRVDEFVLEDADGGSAGVPLTDGVLNTITITGCKADMVTCYQRVLKVTRGASDTTPPSGTVETPTSSLAYPTDQSTISWTGSYSDVGGSVASVVVASATMGVSPASVNASLVGGTWSAGAFAIPVGNSVFTYTITDTAGLVTVLPSRTVTRSAAVDSTAPTVSITSPNGSGSSSTSGTTISLAGTAADTGGSGLAASGAITWTSDGCGGGTAVGSTTWNIASVDLSSVSSCVISVRATDIAGNVGTAVTHTVTRNIPLFITSPSSLTAIEGSAFSFCPTFGGGTGPYTLTKATGTYPTPASPAFSISANCIVGTPSAGSAGAYPGHSYRVTDNVAAQATTSTFTFTVGTGALGGQNNSYYDSVIQRPAFPTGDMWRAYPMRSTTELRPKSQGGYISDPTAVSLDGNPAWSYAPDTDTHPQRQNASKFTLAVWVPSRLLGANLSGASPGGTFDTVQSATNWSGITNGSVLRIGSEIITCVGVNATTNCLDPLGQNGNTGTFSRGNWGTTVAAHTAGDQIYVLRTKLGGPAQAFWPIDASTTTSDSYLVSFEQYLTSDFAGLGADPSGYTNCGGIFFGPNPTSYNASAYCARRWGGFKAYQFRINGNIGWEWKVNTDASYPSIIPAGVNAITGTDVGFASLRLYTNVGPPFLSQDPTRPMTNTWPYKPGRWQRQWAFIELNHDQNTAAFTPFKPLAAAIVTAPAAGTVETISIDYTGLPPAPPTGDNPGGAYPIIWNAGTGRRMRIDSEILSINSCATSGNPRTCTVVRGVDSTTPATHTAGTNVELIWDYLTLIHSDEVNNPTTIMTKVPTTRNRNGSQPGALTDLDWEFDDSNDRAVGFLINNGFHDLSGYVKNIYVLRKSGTGGATPGNVPTEWQALFIKPTVNGN